VSFLVAFEMKRAPSAFPDFCSPEQKFWKGAGNAQRRNRPKKSSTRESLT
jgi:hypothetical protein